MKRILRPFFARPVMATIGVALIAAVAPVNAPAASAVGTGVIRGTVYNDTAEDGLEANERWSAPGVIVYIDANNNNVFDSGEVSTVSTPVHGQYDFENLDPGTYSVKLSVPNAKTIINPGVVVVTTGQNGRQDGGVVFGGSVSGSVFVDRNANQVADADDIGALGAHVILDRDNDGVFSTNDFDMYVDSKGSYKFPSLPDGSYLVQFYPPSSGVLNTPNQVTINVVNGHAVTGVNAAVAYNGSISGRVYVDLNRNRAYDSGEEVPDVDLSLLRTRLDGVLELSTTTADGSFSFTSVADLNNGYVYAINPDDPTDLSDTFDGFTIQNGAHLSRDIAIDVPDVVGYRIATADGNVFNYGNAGNHGSMAGKSLNAPIISMASLPDGSGYWLLARDGGVFTFGNAKFYGSTGGLRLNAPIVAMAVAPDGDGYWLVASDGGVFAYGSATFHGSMGGKPLNKPIVGISADADGEGYWLVASDGGIFAFDAAFAGSAGSLTLNKPIVGMTPDPDGRGYWLVASDGGIFSYDAPFFGSAGSIRLNSPIVGIASTPLGDGYYMLATDGGIFSYPSSRPFFGSPAGSKVNSPAVGISVF